MNEYAHWLTSKEFKEIKEKQVHQQNVAQKLNEDDKKLHSLIVLHNGLKGQHVINSMKKRWNTKLPENNKIETCYSGRRLSALFQIK